MGRCFALGSSRQNPARGNAVGEGGDQQPSRCSPDSRSAPHGPSYWVTQMTHRHLQQGLYSLKSFSAGAEDKPQWL